MAKYHLMGCTVTVNGTELSVSEISVGEEAAFLDVTNTKSTGQKQEGIGGVPRGNFSLSGPHDGTVPLGTGMGAGQSSTLVFTLPNAVALTLGVIITQKGLQTSIDNPSMWSLEAQSTGDFTFTYL